MKTIIFAIILSYLTFFSINAKEAVGTASIKGSLMNATTNRPGFAETLKVIRLGAGMTPIAELKNVNGKFSFSGITGDGPFLLQATYLGINYNQIVPPGTAGIKEHIVKIYEKSSNRGMISVKSLLQIVREKDVIRIHKLFVINNHSLPPKSFQAEASPLEIYIPANAEQIFAQLTQGSGMGIPLELKEGIRGKILDRAILPGSSELQVSFALPAREVADIETTDETLLGDDNVRHIFIKPKDMKVNFKDYQESSQLKEDIPEGLNAYKILYKQNTPLKISLSGGTPVSANRQRIVVNGTFFDSWDRSTLGILAFLGVLFTLSFIFIYKGKKEK